MAGREKKRDRRVGPSTQPVDEGLEGAIFDDERGNDEAEERGPDTAINELDAAATGERNIAPSRSSQSHAEPQHDASDPRNDVERAE
jgi:hypothetical protein